jgi:hypothetical protein
MVAVVDKALPFRDEGRLNTSDSAFGYRQVALGEDRDLMPLRAVSGKQF